MTSCQTCISCSNNMIEKCKSCESYLRSCHRQSSFWAARAGSGPSQCRFVGCACSCAGWPWTCSRSRLGTSLGNAREAPPYTRCFLHPGWWSSSPGQTHPRPTAEQKRRTRIKRRMGAVRCLLVLWWVSLSEKNGSYHTSYIISDHVISCLDKNIQLPFPVNPNNDDYQCL